MENYNGSHPDAGYSEHALQERPVSGISLDIFTKASRALTHKSNKSHVSHILLHLRNTCKNLVARLVKAENRVHSLEQEVEQVKTNWAEEKLRRTALELHLQEVTQITKLFALKWLEELRDEIGRRREAERISITDSLTELATRREILDVLVYAHLEASESPYATVGEQRQARGVFVVVADIDHFKSVNDTYGHAAGDQILKEFSKRLQPFIRAEDKIGRYGGEEFLIVCPKCNDPNIIIPKIEAMRANIDKLPFKITVNEKEIEIYITASFGCSVFKPPSDITPLQLFTQADGAVYQAKRNGRNDIYYHTGIEIIRALPSGTNRRAAAPQQRWEPT